MNDTDGQTTAVLEGANDNMTQPSIENDQPSIVNDQQPQVEDTTDKNDTTAADNIEEDDIPNDGSEEISGEMQSIQL